jgi:membrane-associated phospholipid phosphatase
VTAWPRGVVGVVLACLSLGAFAQAPPKRLSDWLLEQPASPDAYPLGLSWRVPEEAAPQALLLRELLAGLSGRDPLVRADPAALRRLSDWLRSLPVTGRVALSGADARWLEVNPARNPVIERHHSVTLPSRPRTVTVVTEQGDRCLIGHAPGREAVSYLEACNPELAGQIDLAWIAQPDGRIQRFGVARWNREPQDEPAPGAWLWGPSRGSGFPEWLSERLIEFLATQGPAPDGGSIALPAPRAAAAKARAMGVTASDWGVAGLLQTPTARMSDVGNLSFNLARVRPYTFGNVFLQPFEWLEAGFRYVDISTVPYGPADLSGNQTAKDKSFDLKLRLRRESATLPEIAVGFRDIAGTGRFSGEYLVASKRTGNVDWSLGIGWGYLGARGDFRGVGTRGVTSSEGGDFAFSNYFRGPAALFGGLQYQTPWERLIVKLEVDGNNYQREPQGQNQRQRSPLNLGLVYRATSWADLTVGLERGNTLMLGLALHAPLDKLGMPKLLDAPRIPIALARPRQAPDWAATARDLGTQTGWHVQAIEQRGSELRVLLDEASAGYWGDRVDRAAAVLHRDAPVVIDRFVLVYGQGGVSMAEHVVDRNTWVAQLTQWLAPGERREAVVARAPRFEPPGRRFYADARPRFEAGLGFDFQQTLGGPDGFILYQVSAIERMKLRFGDSTWLQGAVRLGLVNNYDKFKYTAPSNLPRVRTFLREYLVTSRLTMPNLQLTHVGKLGDNQYYSAYAGYLEEMFAGVGAEWLYRPFASRLAFGVDVNAVRQRDFHQNLAFRDYRTVTGHATMYWDTGWQNTLAQISVGRYLAKDAGVTVDLSRVFDNGVRIGAFVTRTNASAAQFGEGSFDKGIYVSIPFDALLMRSTTGTANFLWKPLTRDGGAKLARSNSLYGLTAARDERTLTTVPAKQPSEISTPADRPEAWQPAPKLPAAQLRLESRPNLAQWAENKEYEFRLVQALYRQWFRNIEVALDGSRRLNLTLSNDRIVPLSRAAGRAARTALRFAPLETREIRITIVEGTEPLVTYSFIDLQRLEHFLEGDADLRSLGDTVSVDYINPGARESEPLALVGDLTRDEVPLTLVSVLARPRVVDRVRADVAAAARTAAGADWWYAAALGAPILLSSIGLDKRADRYASKYASQRGLKAAIKVGDAIPWIGVAGAALAALDGSNPQRSRVGYAATEAAATAFLAGTALKYAIGRARPDTGLGRSSFQPMTTDNSHNAFPSRHAAVAWAVATTYALEYDADWLYGIAALTNAARVGSRQHWLSDTVAGSLLGYAAGRIFWESSRAQQRAAPAVQLSPAGVKLAWEWQ